MTKTILIPERRDVPADHWQSWWSSVEPGVLILDPPGGARRGGRALADAILDAIPVDLDAILVVHGENCAPVAQLLADRYLSGVSAALFVAPAVPDRIDGQTPLFGVSRSEIGVPTTLVASRTDPRTDLDAAGHLAADWGSRFLDLGDAGGIDAASGFGPWPDGIDLRDDLISRARRTVRPRLLRDIPAQRWAF